MCRHSSHDMHRWHVVCYHCSSRHDGPFTDAYSADNSHIGAQPDIFFDFDVRDAMALLLYWNINLVKSVVSRP